MRRGSISLNITTAGFGVVASHYASNGNDNYQKAVHGTPATFQDKRWSGCMIAQTHIPQNCKVSKSSPVHSVTSAIEIANCAQ
jgi:hypothetical protein